MTTEELIREIISKSCPFHGTRAIVNIPESGPVLFSTCCEDFYKYVESYIFNYAGKVIVKPELTPV